jgi:Mlc titration factor MtfA (ptsG expression regulator)
MREVAGWEHDLHAAMDNIQDEIDLVGESAASIDAYAATDPAECFAVLSEYFSAHLNCSPHVFRRYGNVSVTSMDRIRYRVCAIGLIQQMIP